MARVSFAAVILLGPALAAPSPAAAGADLVPEVSAISIEAGDVPQADVDDGCAGGTTARKLLRFTLRAHNVGTDDLVLGNPGCPDCAANPGAACANPYFHCSLSHGHPHFDGFAQMDLLDGDGVPVVSGRKESFCLRDDECAAPQFTCNDQGISAGCTDVYPAGLPCQYLDVTDAGLEAGTYTLRVTLDPDGRLAESDETNNTTTRTVQLDCSTAPEIVGVCSLDHYLCRSTKPADGAAPFGSATDVTLTGEFGAMQVDLVRRDQLCTPGDADGAGILDPATHLGRYALKPSHGTPIVVPPARLRLVNEFGTLFVDATKPDVVMVPTAVSFTGVPPAPSAPDRYACYRARVSPGTPKLPRGLTATVADAVTGSAVRFDVRKPRHVCIPVAEGDASVRDPAEYLLCYGTRRAHGEPKAEPVHGVQVRNDLETAAVDVTREREVCVPSRQNPPSDLCTAAIVIGTLPFTTTQDTHAATASADDPVLSCGAQTQKSHTVWYAVTAPADGTMTADTYGSDYDTVLAAHTGTCGSLTEVACDDDWGTTLQSRIVFPVAAGTTYLLEVAGYGEPAGTAVLNVSFAP